MLIANIKSSRRSRCSFATHNRISNYVGSLHHRQHTIYGILMLEIQSKLNYEIIMSYYFECNARLCGWLRANLQMNLRTFRCQVAEEFTLNRSNTFRQMFHLSIKKFSQKKTKFLLKSSQAKRERKRKLIPKPTEINSSRGNLIEFHISREKKIEK